MNVFYVRAESIVLKCLAQPDLQESRKLLAANQERSYSRAELTGARFEKYQA